MLITPAHAGRAGLSALRRGDARQFHPCAQWHYVPVHVVEYTAAAPDVSHAVLPQHAWALTAGSDLVVKLAAGAHWDCVVSWLAALCKQLMFVIARFRALTAGSNSVVKILGGWGALDGVVSVGWWHFRQLL